MIKSIKVIHYIEYVVILIKDVDWWFCRFSTVCSELFFFYVTSLYFFFFFFKINKKHFQVWFSARLSLNRSETQTWNQHRWSAKTLDTWHMYDTGMLHVWHMSKWSNNNPNFSCNWTLYYCYCIIITISCIMKLITTEY